MARTSDPRERSTGVVPPSHAELEKSLRRNKEFGTNLDVPRFNEGGRTFTGRGGAYAMSAGQAAGAASLMDRSQVTSPLAGMPVSAGTAEFRTARDILGKATGMDGGWNDYWQDDQSGYDYRNLSTRRQVTNAQEAFYAGVNVGDFIGGAVTSGSGREPAPLSVVPTSSTDYKRPRTVAAGYAEDRQVLTVVFRDGTFYNYYEVPYEMWQDFKAEHSKGEFIRVWLDSQPRGTSEMGGSAVKHREQAYRVARSGQVLRKGDPSGQFDRSLPPRLNPTKSRGRNTSASKPSKNGMRKK